MFLRSHLASLCLAWSLTTLVDGERYTCSSDEFVRLGNSCYHFSTEIVTWQEAHFRCRDMNAQLAVIGTQYEDTSLRNYLEDPEFAQLGRWIGGIWAGGSERKWVWAHGKEIENRRGFASASVFDLQDTDQWMCLFMDPIQRYRWMNDNCVRQMHYICEAPLIKAEVTTTTTQEPYGDIDSLFDDEDDEDDSESDSETQY